MAKGKAFTSLCVASPLKTADKRKIVLQAYVHKCLNRLLMNNGYDTQGTMYFAIKACFDNALITKTCYDKCIIINKEGNIVKHSVVQQACDYLEKHFGSVDA